MSHKLGISIGAVPGVQCQVSLEDVCETSSAQLCVVEDFQVLSSKLKRIAVFSKSLRRLLLLRQILTKTYRRQRILLSSFEFNVHLQFAKFSATSFLLAFRTATGK